MSIKWYEAEKRSRGFDIVLTLSELAYQAHSETPIKVGDAEEARKVLIKLRSVAKSELTPNPSSDRYLVNLVVELSKRENISLDILSSHLSKASQNLRTGKLEESDLRLMINAATVATSISSGVTD